VSWQPIKSAPRGVHFLACSRHTLAADTDRRGDQCAIWHAHIPPGQGRPESALDGEPLFGATHWMPLPPPPTSDGGDDD